MVKQKFTLENLILVVTYYHEKPIPLAKLIWSIILLQAKHNLFNVNIEDLIATHYIEDIISKLIDKGYLIVKADEVILTEKGVNKVNELLNQIDINDIKETLILIKYLSTTVIEGYALGKIFE